MFLFAPQTAPNSVTPLPQMNAQDDIEGNMNNGPSHQGADSAPVTLAGFL